MKQVLIVLVTLLALGCASQQDVKQEGADTHNQAFTMQEYCSSNPCRENHRVKFLVDGGEVDQVLEQYWPVVFGEKISLLPGDRVYIEADLINGKFTNLKSVKEITDASKTITFNFSQMEGKESMMLSVQNPFEQAMKVHLDMIDFQGNPHKTSSCPVMAGGGAYEHWPHAIPELVVSNLRAVELSGGASCEY